MARSLNERLGDPSKRDMAVDILLSPASPWPNATAAKSFRVERAACSQVLDAALLALLDADLGVRAGALDLDHVGGEFPPCGLGVGAVVENGVSSDRDDSNEKNQPDHERSPMS